MCDDARFPSVVQPLQDGGAGGQAEAVGAGLDHGEGVGGGADSDHGFESEGEAD